MPKKKDNRRQRSFNSRAFDNAVREIYDNRLNAKVLKESIEALGCSTKMNLNEIDLIVNTQTGFANPILSADTMGLKEEYLLVSRYIDVIDIDDYEEDFSDVSVATKLKLRDDYTSYWNQEQQERLEKVEKIVEELNEMGHAVRKSFVVNQYGKIAFNEKLYAAIANSK